MKLGKMFAVFTAFAMISQSATATAATERDKALVECQQEALAMDYQPNTIKWMNSVKDCMVDRGFNGG